MYCKIGHRQYKMINRNFRGVRKKSLEKAILEGQTDSLRSRTYEHDKNYEVENLYSNDQKKPQKTGSG